MGKHGLKYSGRILMILTTALIMFAFCVLMYINSPNSKTLLLKINRKTRKKTAMLH